MSRDAGYAPHGRRGDMGFGRGNLTRRQNLQGVGARYLALFATVQVWARAHTRKNVNRKPLDWSEMRRGTKRGRSEPPMGITPGIWSGGQGVVF
jgi:hypothetical protein